MTDAPQPAALVDRLAEVIAESAGDHGTHDYDGQAADVIAFLEAEGRLSTVTAEDVTRALSDAEQHLAAAEHLVARADALDHHGDPHLATVSYAGSSAHSLLAIAGLLRVGLEPEA